MNPGGRPPARDWLAERRMIEAPLDPDRYTTLNRLIRERGFRLVISLGGGSVPGLCGNVALARIIEELGLLDQVAEIWGTSAGAAVGGPWASGSTALEILESLKSLDRFGAIDVPVGRLLWSLLKMPFGGRLPDGLIGGKHFATAIARVLRVPDFEACPIPFRCIACSDDGKLRRVVFRRGPLLTSILSSMSLPGIVIPQAIREGEPHGYYDGGLVEKTPLHSPYSEHQRQGETRPLLLLATHFGNDGSMVPARGFVNRFVQSIYALEDVAWHYQVAELRAKSNATLLLLNPHLDDPALFDFSRVTINYLAARATFADLLQNAKLGLSLGAQ